MDEKRFGKRVWDFFGSRDLSVFIFIMGLTYTLFLVIFGIVVPLLWVTNISKLLPFKILYLLFFINLVICEIKWIPVIIRRCGRPTCPETEEDMQRFRHNIEIQNSKFKIQNLSSYLRRRGYRVTLEVRSQKPEEERVSDLASHISPFLYAYRGRFSTIGNLLFHIAFLFLLAGVAASSLFRFEGRARVPEGYPFSGSRAEYSMSSSALLAGLPNVSFSVEKITPRFWEDQLLYTDLRADVTTDNGPGSAWMSSPLSINGARITITSLGITPRFVLKDKEGKELDTADINLAVFAPGTEDHFQIPGFPHQVFVSFSPDYYVSNGKAGNRSMELNNPVYLLKVFRGRLLVYSGGIRPKEEAVFEGLRLSFPEIRYWGEFRIIRDPGFTIIWIAFVLFGIGLVLRLLFYKREVFVVEKDGVVHLYGSSDYYHRLFEDGFAAFAGMTGEK